MPYMLRMSHVSRVPNGPFVLSNTNRTNLLRSYRWGLVCGLLESEHGEYLAFQTCDFPCEVNTRHHDSEKAAVNGEEPKDEAYHVTTKHLAVASRIGAAIGACYARKFSSVYNFQNIQLCSFTWNLM